MSEGALLKLSLLLVVCAGGVILSLLGFPALLLFGAGVALTGVIYLVWTSLQGMDQDSQMSFEQALSFAAPSSAEEQKRALLRTLKDLEYELSVGKISREDYEEVSQAVREKAKLLIAQNDEALRERLAQAEARVTAYEALHAKKENATARKKQPLAHSEPLPDSEPLHGADANANANAGAEASEDADSDASAEADSGADADASEDADSEEKRA